MAGVLILSASGTPLEVQPNFVTPAGDTDLQSGRVATIPHTGNVGFSANMSMISGSGSVTIEITAFANGLAIDDATRTITITSPKQSGTLAIPTPFHQFVARVSARTGDVGSVTLNGEGA